MKGTAYMVESGFRLGRQRFGTHEPVVMAIVNRTRDSFYDKGATYAEAAAMERVEQVVEQGARIVDVGGVKAGPGDEVDAAEEIRRVASFVESVRGPFPDRAISGGTRPARGGGAVCPARADPLTCAYV